MMTEENTETYNGWKNYPTWAVNLWLSNDEGLYNDTQQLVNSAKLSNVPEHSPLRFDVAEDLKRWVTDSLAPDLGASFAADLLGYALDEVDWYEIADAWLEEN